MKPIVKNGITGGGHLEPTADFFPLLIDAFIQQLNITIDAIIVSLTM
jgi:hypothetical protein